MHAELTPACLRRFLSSQASCDFSVLDFLKILEYRLHLGQVSNFQGS